jgi:small subunit ribosomal protein S7
MPRTGRIKKRLLMPDPIYANRQVTRLVNRVMKDGKKQIAFKQIYQALEIIKEKTETDNPVETFNQALENIKPNVEVRSRRVGGAAYQVPMPVKGDRREALAIRWLIFAARKRASKEYHTFSAKLAAEIIDASKNEGGAIQKKQETHRMAEANKAFSHFRW